MHETITREHCVALDQRDPLRATRDRFAVPPNTVYLDGNSLGALPVATAARINDCVAREWGSGLVRSWNRADWVNAPQRLGDRLAALLGACAGEIVVADSTSVNLFKLLAAVLMQARLRNDASRCVILSERGNFPTDLYIAEGVNAMLGGRYTLRLVEAEQLIDAFSTDVAVAVITQVDYRSARLHDMSALNRAAAVAGCRIIWDLSHSAGALPVALNDSGAALAVGCGYKYLNGGPGAPAYCYVKSALQAELSSPLSGWFGHARPFDFSVAYEPAAGIGKFLCGTPSILALTALECGLATFDGVSMSAVRDKSMALTTLFRRLMKDNCAGYGFEDITPARDEERGSHLSFAHPDGYAVMQALIARNVIGDFRQPDLLRFGFAPLYVGFTDCWDAVQALSAVMKSREYAQQNYQQRSAVT